MQLMAVAAEVFSVASDSFSVTLKAISAGKASISLSATDGVIYGTKKNWIPWQAAALL